MFGASKIGVTGLLLLVVSGCLNNALFSPLEPVGRVRQSSSPVQPSNPVYSGGTPEFYLVKPGDTLYSIAFRFGLDYKKLAYANKIDHHYRIYEGQSLELKEATQPHRAVKPAVSPSPKPSINASHSQASKITSNSESQIIDDGNVAKTSTSNGLQSWKWPHGGKIVRAFSSQSSGGKGIDLQGRIGDSVVAAANGVVVYAGNGLPGYGNLVILEHLNGLLSAYAFNEQILVKEKDKVSSGQKIATMGKQGDQPGLHFEIRQNGKPINPLRFLPKR
ncbi:MAG: peptidoglycan DD-metalloendopeptidase family protein [Reinekea sp.]